jgi:hypothetical protein
VGARALRRLGFATGALCGLAALLLGGETMLRFAPPEDLLPYLGAASPLAGPYAPDPVLGATYRSFDDFKAAYADRLAELTADNDGRRVWAMFGNSFVQAPGMLGDTAQRALPDRQMFFLRRNEPVYLRVAQFRLLLENGLRPERAFFTLLPIDLFGIALEPMAAVTVTPGGGIGHAGRKPALIAPALDHSWLGLLAWTRSGRHRPLPGFRLGDVLKITPDLVKRELHALAGEIARIGRRHGVPVSIVFIPNREQIFGNGSTMPQDAVAAAARKAGLDFIDPTPAFLAEAGKSGLLIADGHLSDRGNALLLSEMLAHLGRQPGTAGAP